MFGKSKEFMFKCHLSIVLPNGKVKKCKRKFSTLQQLVDHAERSHGGAGREI